jgi:HD-GYP domain-containing protein (c-di-GMP phosphodiesterase class II)
MARTARGSAIIRTTETENERGELRNVSLEIITSFVNVLEAKDPFFRGHSERVGLVSGRIADELRLAPDEVERVRLAGRLHDVGMAGIPEHILLKAGSLTKDELALVQTHVELGMGILAPINFLGDVLTFVREHHEHYDGGGYPAGLVGAAISIGGRIVAAADAYDALTSARSFRGAFSPSDTLEILGRKRGKLLDPVVYGALVKVTSG